MRFLRYKDFKFVQGATKSCTFKFPNLILFQTIKLTTYQMDNRL